jgi:hypothetical protein
LEHSNPKNNPISGKIKQKKLQRNKKKFRKTAKRYNV